MNKNNAQDYLEAIKECCQELKDNVFFTVYASKEAETKDFNACLKRMEKYVTKLKNEQLRK